MNNNEILGIIVSLQIETSNLLGKLDTHERIKYDLDKLHKYFISLDKKQIK